MRKMPHKLNEYGLTEKEEEFCNQYVFIYLDPENAFKAVYNFNDEKYGKRYMKEIMAKPHVKRRLNQLFEEKNERVLVDRMYVISRFKDIAEKERKRFDDAVATGKMNCNFSRTNEIKALENLAKILGMHEQKHVIEERKDAASMLDEAFKKRMDNKVIPFPKEGTNDEAQS